MGEAPKVENGLKIIKQTSTMGKAPKVSTGLKTLKQTSTMGKAPKVSTGLKSIKQASTMGKAPKVSTGLKTIRQTLTMGKAPKVSTGLKRGGRILQILSWLFRLMAVQRVYSSWFNQSLQSSETDYSDLVCIRDWLKSASDPREFNSPITGSTKNF